MTIPTYLPCMIELQINNTFYLPSSWDEVSLQQYIDILNARLDKLNSNILKMIKALAILANDQRLEQEVRMLDQSDLNTLLTTFSWINETPDYNALPPIDTLVIDGVTFRIKKDFNTLCVDEVVMIEELMQTDNFDLHHFEIAFGVLFRKLDDQGNEEALTLDLLLSTIMQFKNKVMLKDVFAVLAFFLIGDKGHSSKTSAYYTQNQNKVKMNMQLKKK